MDGVELGKRMMLGGCGILGIGCAGIMFLFGMLFLFVVISSV
jgi:hypothetical protein